MLRWSTLILGVLLLIFLGIVGHQWYVDSHPFLSKSDKAVLKLHRGPFAVLRFEPEKKPASGVILFISGDGGWESFEEASAHALQKGGYEVIGIDASKYAATDYDLPILQEDFSTIAREALLPYGFNPPPLIIGGWSMGAAQSIAIMGGPHPPRNVAGLLLVSPMSRGRYGLRASDRIDILPLGTGTFAVSDFAQTLNQVRVIQWHAGVDITDSRAWLKDVTAPHREFDFPGAGHEFYGPCPEFLQQFVDSVNWILHPDSFEKNAGAK